MTRTEHSKKTCAWLVRNIAHLLSGDNTPTKEDVIGSLHQMATDLDAGTEGMTALHKLASDQARAGSRWPDTVH
jgi:hypothetical protein